MTIAEQPVLAQTSEGLPFALFQQLLSTHRKHFPHEEQAMIAKAYQWGVNAHTGQVRKSGEPYIEHPLQVALIIAEQGLDGQAVAAAILHDAVEDTDVTLEELASEFSPEVAAIVDGCTKIENISFDSKAQRQAASIRKLMVAVAKDMRVLIIKLADRLHNMRTVAVMPVAKQRRIAQETLGVYAPLAHRLGMEELKAQLEDLSFAVLHPKWFAEIDRLVAARDPEREVLLAQLIAEVEERLAKAGIRAKVFGRTKHIYSIFEKYQIRGHDFEQIYDLIGLRVICPSGRDCYGAIGEIHSMYMPMNGRFKDYIATPKFNMYQSLHTTVVGPQRKQIEFQVRTEEMDARAQRGFAAHWAYKEKAASRDLAWLQRISDFSDDFVSPDEFLQELKSDLKAEEVCVLTPKGKLVSLPAGASVVDFAYAIHTEIGNRAVGAVVNSSKATLSRKLATGDIVEVLTSKHDDAAPSESWLDFVVTHRAQSSIRRWYNRERAEDMQSKTYESIFDGLVAEGLPATAIMESNSIEEIASQLGYADREALFVAVGLGHISVKKVVSRVATALYGGAGESEARMARTMRTPTEHSEQRAPGVHVEGGEGQLLRIARCCRPAPPDDIVAFETRGRGISIHRNGCEKIVPREAEAWNRLLEASWDVDAQNTFVCTFKVSALDRKNLLVDVATVISNLGGNILRVETKTSSQRGAVMNFEVQLIDNAQLEAIIASVLKVEHVYALERDQ